MIDIWTYESTMIRKLKPLPAHCWLCRHETLAGLIFGAMGICIIDHIHPRIHKGIISKLDMV